MQVSVVAADLLLKWRVGEANAPLLIPILLTRWSCESVKIFWLVLGICERKTKFSKNIVSLIDFA